VLGTYGEASFATTFESFVTVGVAPLPTSR
jgi:hypothetical protein